MNILSIHSSVALGHVGNSGIGFVLRRLGHEVWPINTVTFSNHPAHGGFRGRVTPAAEIAELVQGLGERGVLARCDAVLSGYLGAVEQGAAVSDAVTAVRKANPRALWLLDPVIGDGTGAAARAYVKPGIAEWLRDRAAPEADILTPNAFELAALSGRAVDTTETALAAMEAVRAGSARGPCAVIATGLGLCDAPPERVTSLAVDGRGAWRVAVPRVNHPAHGAGDIFAAVLLGRLLGGEPLPQALAGAAACLSGIIARTGAAEADLAVVAAQDEIAAPRQFVPVEALR